MLRGAGVALALPWLESLAAPARAQAAAPPKRFVAIFLPCGAPDFWKPATPGQGNSWQLSSLLDPLAQLKSRVNVISGLESGTVFNADGGESVEPSHGRLPAAWLSCDDAGRIRRELMVDLANGVTVDQLMAASSVFAGQTPLPSLQVGLTSVDSFCDGQPCANSRSVSWETQTKPLYKLVNPQEVLDLLTGAKPEQPGNAQRASRTSVLDAVKETASALRARVSVADRQRLDDFLTSVRSVEQRVSPKPPGSSCSSTLVLPPFPEVSGNFRSNTGGYDKGLHADLMNDLVALAFRCDQTRIVSYMLEDERSEFTCDHIPVRNFGPYTSAPGTGVCGEWHGAGQSGSLNVFGSIVRWNVGKVAELCQRLANISEADGSSVLDNSVVFLGAAMHGQDHQASRLPAVAIGGGGGALKTDQHLELGSRPLRDFYFTLMKGVYGVELDSFGYNAAGLPATLIPELLS